MKVLPLNAYTKWTEEVYGPNVPHNVYSVEKMLTRWQLKELEQLGHFLNRDTKLGPVTFNDRLAILRRFTKWCIKRKYLKHDPLENCMRRRNDAVNLKREPYTDSELISLLDYFNTNPYLKKYYHPYLMFLVLTGARNGEASALKCGMVDFFNKRVFICRNYARDNKGKRYLKTPKTASGNRYIPMSEELEQLLKPICEKRKATDFVFTTRFHKPVCDKRFQQRILKPALEKLGIPVRDLYACRHTFGTVAVEQNIDILSLAYLMGHRKPRTVLDYYTRLRNKPKELPRVIPVSRIS